jgi:hypothetical protein
MYFCQINVVELESIVIQLTLLEGLMLIVRCLIPLLNKLWRAVRSNTFFSVKGKYSVKYAQATENADRAGSLPRFVCLPSRPSVNLVYAGDILPPSGVVGLLRGPDVVRGCSPNS